MDIDNKSNVNQDKPKSSLPKVLGILFIILIGPVIWVIFNKTGVHYAKPLPILFERELNSNGDTIYHTIENFRLVNQQGDSVTLDGYKNKILLVNFFFTSCESVCPKLTYFIRHNIYNEFEKDTNIQFLSISVDPKNDSVPVLQKYAQQFGAKYPRWQFLTGNKNTIQNLANLSFRISGSEDHQGIFHSNKLALVDKNLRVRGVFDTEMINDGSSPDKVIIDAVRILNYEYAHPENFTTLQNEKKR